MTTSIISVDSTTSKIQVGGVDSFSFTAAGILGISSVDVSDDLTTNASYYPMWSTGTTGQSTIYVSSTKLFFNPSTGTLNATNFNSLSDTAFKKNVVDIGNASNTIRKLRGVEFQWIDNGIKSAGVIAQEVADVLPHLVSESDGIKSVNYSGIIAYLIESNKDLQRRLDLLENRSRESLVAKINAFVSSIQTILVNLYRGAK